MPIVTNGKFVLLCEALELFGMMSGMQLMKGVLD